MAWKAKSLVVAGILAAGGAGVAIGHTRATTREIPRARRLQPDTRVAELRQELDELRRAHRTLQARLDVSAAAEQPPKPEAAPGAAPAIGPQRPPRNKSSAPDSVRQAGTRLGVEEALIQAAWNTHNAPTPEGRRANFELLRSAGKQGFLAYATLLYASMSGTHMDAKFAQLWGPECAGAEAALIDFIGLKKQYGYAKWTAYRALGAADTPVAREFLIRAAGTEPDSGRYLSLAMSLGELKEPRAFDDLARRISNKQWHRNVRTPIIAALIKIDPERAKAVLMDHLRAHDTDLLVNVVYQLGFIDPALRRSEAQALLDGTRARSLDAAALARLEEMAR